MGANQTCVRICDSSPSLVVTTNRAVGSLHGLLCVLTAQPTRTRAQAPPFGYAAGRAPLAVDVGRGHSLAVDNDGITGYVSEPKDPSKGFMHPFFRVRVFCFRRNLVER